ncbi:MAG TPA: DUF4287 domain-containing protein [Thermoanaerobaculia bacterium]|nr:DUF4287 domain-containing protein [Thermoanaerobaculia bacterium]
MTQQKKLKKVIRARSGKTGESYTAARRQVLLAREEPAPEPPAPKPPAPKPPAKGGISEESVLKKTGHGLDHWFGVLDAFGGTTKGHTAMAAHLYNEHGIPGWHSQGITVAYERARGLREANQACTGKFQVSVSKTVPATVAEVVEALKSTSWLQGADPGLAQALGAAFTGDKPREVKTKGSGYAWLRFPWDGRTVEIRITGKPKGASVVADNKDLPDPALVEQRRAQWRTALEGLQRHLSR